MFDIGFQELVLIFVIALLVFGPKNLPQLGRSLGRAMREFRRASDEFRNTIETNLQMNEIDPPPTLQPAIETPPAEPVAAEVAATPGELTEPAAGGEATEETSGEPYLAQRGARLFHSRQCAWVKRIAEPERVYFKRVADAREAGFLSCPTCDPWEPS
jgi:Tat protein translocase TatB subunit